MNATLQKPLDEILAMLKRDANVLILACTGCPIGMKTGRPEDIETLVANLRANGKKVLDVIGVEMVCNKALTGSRLALCAETVGSSDAIMVSSCGVGVQATAAMIGRRVVPALNTIHVGGQQGLFPSDERCFQCGNCVLHMTGGLCPFATCSKQLSNGTCGGTNKGMCEVSPEKPCGWLAIYERLKELNRLDLYARPLDPRDYAKLDIPAERRRTPLWAIEMVEKPAKEARA